MIEIDKYIDKNGLFDGKYLLIRQLSTEGGTADVWLAEDKETADQELSDENEDEVIEVEGSAVLVAIKIYRPKNILDAEGIQIFKKEYKTVYNCHHANLLKPTGFSIIDESIPYLVMPYCEKGSAAKQIGMMRQKDDIWKFIYDTASGLAYLHSCTPPIIHQDIKPANILIDDKSNYCITDFGISVKTGNNAGDFIDDESSGTIIYMPPERFEEGYKPIPQSDIWSLGATIYELITGDVPFGDEGGASQKKGIKIPEIKVQSPSKVKKLVYACLNQNPDKRPTAESIAEYARNKGRNNWLLNISILTVLIVVASSLFLWSYIGSPEPPTPFAILCNSGDSIINIEKNNANSTSPVEYPASINHLNEAVRYYERALDEECEDIHRKDSITNRIEGIKELPSLFEKYKGVCDSLKIAEEDDVEIQKVFFKERRDAMSDIIKNKIIKL